MMVVDSSGNLVNGQYSPRSAGTQFRRRCRTIFIAARTLAWTNEKRNYRGRRTWAGGSGRFQMGLVRRFKVDTLGHRSDIREVNLTEPDRPHRIGAASKSGGSHCGSKTILLARFAIARSQVHRDRKVWDRNGPGEQTREIWRTVSRRNGRKKKRSRRPPDCRRDSRTRIGFSPATSGRNSPSANGWREAEEAHLATNFAKWLTHIAVTMALTKIRSSIPIDDVVPHRIINFLGSSGCGDFP